MSPFAVGLIGVLVMFLFIFLRMPIAVAMLATGFLGIAYVASLDAALASMALNIYAVFSDHTFTIIPLFILMGQLAHSSGISPELFDTADKWLRRLPQ